MPKQSGLGDNLYIGGYNLSGDIQAVEGIGGGPAAGDFTGIDKFGFERIGLERDGRLTITTFFNPSASQEHPVLKVLPYTDVIMTYVRGTVLGNPCASIVAKQPNYDGKVGQGGDFTFTVDAVPNGYGVEWGQSGTAGVRSDIAATNGAGVDGGAGPPMPTLFGLQAYLQVFSFTGTSVTIKIQESNDDGAGDPYADTTGGSFGAISALGTARIATNPAQTVKRYTRVVTTGTFSQCSFHVNIVRNIVATVF